MAGYDPFVELLPGEPIYSDGNIVVTTRGVFPAPCNSFSDAFSDAFCGGIGAGDTELTGTVSAVAATSGAISTPTNLSGTSSAVASASGSIKVSLELPAASVSTVASASGLAGITLELAGVVDSLAQLADSFVFVDPKVLNGSIESVGETEIFLSVISDNRGGFPIPYPLGRAGKLINDLTMLQSLKAAVSTQAIMSATSSMTAVSSVSGNLSALIGSSNVSAVAEASGDLSVFEVTGELTGDVTGVAGTTGFRLDPKEQPRFLYIYVDAGVGFDPTDDYSSPEVGTFVSQNFPDGTNIDLDRFLYQLLDVGVGFDPTDAYPGPGTLVSQNFPDGHIRDDFARYLYQLVNVIRERRDRKDQLVIRPGYTDGKPALPTSKPPSIKPS